MSAIRRIRWRWVFAAGFLAEAAILAVFFLLLLAFTLAGVPEIAAPMSTLDNIDALVSSFVMFYLLTLWAGKRIETDFVLHGVLIGLTGMRPVHRPVDHDDGRAGPAVALRRRSLSEGARRNHRRGRCQEPPATLPSR